MVQPVKIDLNDIKTIENYRGFKKIWCYTPLQSAPELHLGYMDDVFFTYKLSPYLTGISIEKPETVIDHYIDRIFLKCSGLEYDWVFMDKEYRKYLDALNSVKAMAESP
jgi:hypothetical protein